MLKQKAHRRKPKQDAARVVVNACRQARQYREVEASGDRVVVENVIYEEDIACSWLTDPLTPGFV